MKNLKRQIEYITHNTKDYAIFSTVIHCKNFDDNSKVILSPRRSIEVTPDMLPPESRKLEGSDAESIYPKMITDTLDVSVEMDRRFGEKLEELNRDKIAQIGEINNE
jgi:hypothetical protein